MNLRRTMPLWIVAIVLPSIRASAGDAPKLLKVDDAVVTLIEQTDLPARAAGPLNKLGVREGQYVREGELIAEVDDQVARLALARAAAEHDIARAEAANEFKVLAAEKAAAAAKAELKRAEESAEKFAKSISETELDRLRLLAERGELELRQALHERDVARLTLQLKEVALEEAKANVMFHHLTAPALGMVVEIFRRPGEWVEPGAPVVRLVNMESLRIEAFVAANDAIRFGPDSPVRFETYGEAKQIIQGTVQYISPEVDPVNGQVRIWVQVENREAKLRPGLQGGLEIMLSPGGEESEAEQPAASKKPAKSGKSPVAAPTKEP